MALNLQTLRPIKDRSTKGHFTQGSRNQKPRDQFEANSTLNWTLLHIRNQGCHTVAFAIDIMKYLKAKEELWKLKYFTMQKYNLQNIL
jgi:hypothetical protein